MNERTAPATFDCDHHPQGSQPEPDNEILYVSMDLHRWDGCKLEGIPDGIFEGLGNGSIGFMAVFDDIDKLKAAYPGSEVSFAMRRD